MTEIGPRTVTAERDPLTGTTVWTHLFHTFPRASARVRADGAPLVVEEKLAVELKTVEKLLPVHGAQLLGYVKPRRFRTGLLVTFNVPILREGLRRTGV